MLVKQAAIADERKWSLSILSKSYYKFTEKIESMKKIMKKPKNLEWTCEKATLSFCAKQNPVEIQNSNGINK